MRKKFIDTADGYKGETVAVMYRNSIHVNSTYSALMMLNNAYPGTDKLDKYAYHSIVEHDDYRAFVVPNTRRLRREFMRWIVSEKTIEQEV
jgi:hypothetical protein